MYVRLFLLIPLMLLAGCFDLGSQKPAPVTTYGQSSGVGSAGVHNVVAGDTLYTVSSAYRLPMRDIVLLNNMKAPFKLREGQRLKLPPPQQYTVQGGDTIYDVSRLFGVNSSEIARLNKMSPPYSLRSGQVLRLPSMTRKTQIASLNKPQGKRTSNVPSGTIEREVLIAPEKAIGKRAVDNTIDAEIVTEPEEVEMTIGSIPVIPSEKPQIGGMKHIERVTTKTPARTSSKFLRPVDGKIISDFGPKTTGLHNDGINISAKKGTPVRAAENGVVVYAGNELKGSGNLVLVRHEDQWVTAYAHMDNIDVRKGDVIKRGETIGAVGMTGSVNEPQLHFEIRRGTDAINPKNYLEK